LPNYRPDEVQASDRGARGTAAEQQNAAGNSIPAALVR